MALLFKVMELALTTVLAPTVQVTELVNIDFGVSKPTKQRRARSDPCPNS